MPESPIAFAERYEYIAVHGLNGTKFVSTDRYLSGSPWKKKWNRKVLWDLNCFLNKRERYKDGRNGAEHHTWSNDSGLFAYVHAGSYFLPWLSIDMTWKQLQMAFYGKATPARMTKALRIIDYYLTVAEPRRSNLGWSGSSNMSLTEFARWYLGIDCNGFTGAYLETHYPGLDISPNDHINYLDSKLKKRKDLSEVRVGDILSREGGGGTRHVCMVSGLFGYVAPGASEMDVMVTHSAGSRGGPDGSGGLGTQYYSLKLHGSGSKPWDLKGYYKFHHCLAPERK